MDDQMLFDRFHAAFDVEPPTGAFDRLRGTMSGARYRVSRKERLRLQLGRNALRIIAAAAVIAIALAGAGTFIAINHYVHRPPVPVLAPHGAATGTCTSGLHMASATSGWNGILSHTSDGGATWTESNGPSLPNETKGGGGGCTLDGFRAWSVVAAGQSPISPDALVVMITDDGGKTWKQGGSVPAHGINSQATLDFINSDDGWLLLDFGESTRSRALYTTWDGGFHWLKVASGSSLDSTAQGCAESGLTFVSGDRGWVTWDCSRGFSEPPSGGGAVVAATDDGGVHWTPVTLPSMPMTSDYMCSASPPLFVKQAGVMPVTCGGVGHGGWGGVYRTNDLGRSWSLAQAPWWFQVGNVQFVNATLGFAFVNPGSRTSDLYSTRDAGQRWTLVKKDVFSGQDVGQFTFISATVGFASTSTSQGAFWKTTDGGLTWTLPGHRVVPGNVGCPAAPDPGAAAPLPVLMSSPTTGWALGARRTTDGGSHWTATGPPVLPFQSSGYSDFFLDGAHAWVAETAGSATMCADHIVVFSTSDGGQSWNASDAIAVPNSPDGSIWGGVSSGSAHGSITGPPPWLDFVDAEDGWMMVQTQASGMMSMPKVGPLYRTTDGGRHWNVVSIDPIAGSQCSALSGFAFSSPTTGWIPLPSCSANSALTYLVTRDGGATWAEQSLGIDCGCQGSPPVWFDSLHGYLFEVGAFAFAFTSDGGKTWKSAPVPAQEALYAVEFTDPAHGWAVVGDMAANDYQLKKTTDGGRTWTVVNAKMPPLANYGNAGSSLLFFSTQNGFWATGAALYRTSDGGKTWKEVPAS
jgi:photosystem II stability/assembly factor-like uncharacterized protein